jgi:predicted kinase
MVWVGIVASTLFLFRGLPGCGKSTLSSVLCNVTLSADDFFMEPSADGWQYRFNPANIKQAHRQCLTNTEAAIRLGISLIGVANTFTQKWELAPYYALAQRYGIQVFSLIVENRHEGKTLHGVPGEVMDAMQRRFEVQLRADPGRVCSVCKVTPLRHNNKTGVCSRCQQNGRKLH